MSALRKICGSQALLPSSLKIPLRYDRSGVPLCRGGFADVWKGKYQGRDIAVKVLKVDQTSDSRGVASVSSQILRKAYTGQLIVTIEVL